MGISIAATVLTRMTQVNWHRLGGDISPANPALQQWLAARQLGLSDPMTPRLLAHELGRQASMIGFIDAFWMVTLSFLVLAPLLLLFRRKPDTAGTSMSG
jgi:DHA2 family multidrug resistance protein